MTVRVAVALVLAFACTGCLEAPDSGRPNILWIVWDTVRADRLGLYGHTAKTTPHLEQWAGTARVYDATSVSCWTIPSHASMFTGLYPREHGMNRLGALLDAERPTVASLLREAGYETYLFSANPHVSRRTGLANGFETIEHPHDKELTARAREVVLSKLHPDDRSSNLRARIAAGVGIRWHAKAVGELVNERFFHFLERRDAERPFFAFLNYMEAHRVRVPPEAARRRVMSDAQVDRSYRLFQGQSRMFEWSLGVRPLPAPEDAEIVSAVYDATVAELDALLDEVLSRLDAGGLLERTVVVLTSDHGEHLGDHGSYLHQYSLYDGVLRVPLVVWAPGRLEPGREPVPVSTLDLFATLLEIAGVDAPADTAGVSLLRPQSERTLVAEYDRVYAGILSQIGERFPDWDSTPWRRTLRAARVGRHKLLIDSNGVRELYDLAEDPGETRNLSASRPELAKEIEERLRAHDLGRADVRASSGDGRELNEDEKEQLRALGYL